MLLRILLALSLLATLLGAIAPLVIESENKNRLPQGSQFLLSAKLHEKSSNHHSLAHAQK